jgi:hypothetical protein
MENTEKTEMENTEIENTEIEIMEKILITGTGRCGTTFLIKLFSFLDFDTGFTRENYKKFTPFTCNAGMEKKYKDNNYILKNPDFLINMNFIIKDEMVRLKHVIIPIRDYKKCAESRASHGERNGGFVWGAKDMASQLTVFHTSMADYIRLMAIHDIPTIFLDFEKMIKDKKYLFEKLKPILEEKNIGFDLFSDVYNEVSLSSRSIK